MANIWIIGAGGIAIEYTKVLKALNKEFITIGRGHNSAVSYYEATGIKPIEGGLDEFIETRPEIPEYAIIAVNVEFLAETTISLMKCGVKNIFCEKPGFNDPSELDDVVGVAKETGANVFYAYNRRFFASVLEAEKIIKEDGRAFNGASIPPLHIYFIAKDWAEFPIRIICCGNDTGSGALR